MALPSANAANTLSVEINDMNPRKAAVQGPDMGSGSPWNNAQLFSSASVEWGTPSAFLAQVVEEFGPFELDVAAQAHNAVCPDYLSPSLDALGEVDWVLPNMKKRLVWMNPPWGRGVGAWVEKASQQCFEQQLTVVCLLPANTDTGWWHKVIMKHADEVRLVRGRLHFVRDDGHSGPCPKGVALVVFRFPSWHLDGGPQFSTLERA